jgi:hypothetical protein
MADSENSHPEPLPSFQPRVEAEEGDPTRGDFIIGALILLVVVAGILWAMGVINWPR